MSRNRDRLFWLYLIRLEQQDNGVPWECPLCLCCPAGGICLRCRTPSRAETVE